MYIIWPGTRDLGRGPGPGPGPGTRASGPGTRSGTSPVGQRPGSVDPGTGPVGQGKGDESGWGHTRILHKPPTYQSKTQHIQAR